MDFSQAPEQRLVLVKRELDDFTGISVKEEHENFDEKPCPFNAPIANMGQSQIKVPQARYISPQTYSSIQPAPLAHNPYEGHPIPRQYINPKSVGHAEDYYSERFALSDSEDDIPLKPVRRMPRFGSRRNNRCQVITTRTHKSSINPADAKGARKATAAVRELNPKVIMSK